MSTFDAVDLFAGPGGWDEGAKRVGLTTVGLEWDHAACQTAVAAGHPRLRCDVAQYPTAPFVGIRGLIASPPCQDFSLAGKRAGLNGDRGQLHAAEATEGLFGETRPWASWGDVIGSCGTLRHVRGAGMIERHGERPDRPADRPSFTVTSKARSWLIRHNGTERKVTVAEASQLQSFPANYPWRGSRSKRFEQVGNAVPPRLAAHVLAALTGAEMRAAA